VYKDSREVYREPALDVLPWLLHGFGTRLADLSGVSPRLATVKQVHSASCVFADGRTGQLGEGDALLENTPGCVVAIKTADCLPILLADEHRRAVAAVHAGWRGTVAGIAGRAVEAMRERFGTEPADLHAALGPAIGPCCYEVGTDVARHFGGKDRMHVDLADANRRSLVAAGVSPERIYTSDLCTMCRPYEFHSYRRDKEAAGRMFSFAGIRPAVE
jgi:YfiH family protein